MSGIYEINERNQVVPYTSGRKCTDTRAWRDATELEIYQKEEITQLERELAEALAQRAKAVEKYQAAVKEMYEAGMQRDRLIKSVEPLKYWRDISECDCSNPLPQGGCLRCDLNRILKTTNPNEL